MKPLCSETIMSLASGHWEGGFMPRSCVGGGAGETVLGFLGAS